MMSQAKIQIVVAGASGYVGRALIPQLLEKFPNAEVTALSRSTQESEDPRVQWQACDLFSLKALEKALPEKIDLAIYLVHSMGPTAQLDQGNFADYDLILADNFARSVERRSAKQIIYLGGLIPEAKNLSLHLQSRLEVEEIFTQYKTPTTIFRAGLILGEDGSSFQILLKLVQRLPFMLCPHWTQTLTTPVDLLTVLSSMTEVALELEHLNRTYDLAGCEALTYVDMMKLTALRLGKKRYFIPLPFFTPTLSRLWVSLITNSSKDLVYPLVESLEHPMVARPEALLNKAIVKKSYAELLDNAALKIKAGRSLFRFRAQRKTVRSVQRLILPKNSNAEQVRAQYVAWLPEFLFPFLLVNTEGEKITFSFLHKKIRLLQLNLNLERSDPDRQLMYLTDGLLLAKTHRGRLEFRVVLHRQFVLAAIHDFEPALPWYIYRYTQAQFHLFVMNAFARHLARQSVLF
jgi:uncharacterized protein YbjT (DUF2867 family)